MTTTTPPKHDRTQTRRQNRRRQRLNKVAQAQGKCATLIKRLLVPSQE